MTSTVEKLLQHERPLIIGHRGYCAIAPENTLPSFKLALEAGADLIELDYQHSKDGIPIVIHDPTLDRTTDARKRWNRRRIKVSQTTSAEIQTLDAGKWFAPKFTRTRIPLLAEALDFICGNGGVPLIEHKSGDAVTLATLLRERDLINKVVVISFNWKFLREFHELEPKQVLGALGPPARLSNGRRPLHARRRLVSRLKDFSISGAKLAVWNQQAARQPLVKAHRQGIKIWIYTINHKRSARQLWQRGISGIITNRIETIQDALSHRKIF